MKRYDGKCGCGTVRVVLSLPAAIETYAPRACDCNFCQSRNGIYVSDPAGALKIITGGHLTETKQGDEIAIMLHCSKCNDLISAAFKLNGELRGNVCAPLLGEANKFQPAVPISPQKLPPAEKIARWSELWMPITIEQV